MRQWVIILCASASLFGLTIAGLSHLVGAHAAGPDEARQKELIHLVRQDCGSCHGMTLKGGLGKPLLAGNLAAWSPDDIADVILNGIPDTPMPPWQGELTSDEALWIAEQLQKGFPQ